MFHGRFTHLRSSLLAGVAALLLGGSFYLKAPAQTVETEAFLGRWSSAAAAEAKAVPVCSKEAGFITFGPSQLHFATTGSALDFTPNRTSYRRYGKRLTLAMAMATADGDVDWQVDLAINRDGTLSYEAMSGAYVQLAEMAYGLDFEQEFSRHWARLQRCNPVAARL